MKVKLLAPRTRGESDFARGDEYECSEAEGAALVEHGMAEKLRETKPDQSTPKEAVVEAAAVKAPEKAVASKPRARG